MQLRPLLVPAGQTSQPADCVWGVATRGGACTIIVDGAAQFELASADVLRFGEPVTVQVVAGAGAPVLVFIAGSEKLAALLTAPPFPPNATPASTLLSFNIPAATSVQLDAGENLLPGRSHFLLIADGANPGPLKVALGADSFVDATPGDPGTYFPLPAGSPLNAIPCGSGNAIWVRNANASACVCYLVQA
jgi:hypothetical protein